MTHELKKIIESYLKADQKAVLATVVDLKGSSYRKPGVRMLLFEDGQLVGAVSGGCVEKEVYRQALEVFETGEAKMMTYDGRFRLGCEGILYILLEPFQPSEALIAAFNQAVRLRQKIEFISFYEHEIGSHLGIGSLVKFTGNQVFKVNQHQEEVTKEGVLPAFVQELAPCFKLVIIGAEHDAVQLCLYASLTGWEVTVVAGALEQKTKANFPGAQEVIAMDAEQVHQLQFDSQTAVVMMTHSFAKDLKYLSQLQHEEMCYIGLLGPIKRREKLITTLLAEYPAIDLAFLEKFHGPAGLNIGAVTPQEIAISIISEILAVVSNNQPIKLSEKSGAIHAKS